MSCGARLLGQSQTAVEDRFIAASRNLQNKWLIGPLGCEVSINALPQLRGVHSYYIVLASIVSRRSAEDLGPDLLFVDVVVAFFQRFAPHIKKKITQPSRTTEMFAGSHTFNERTSFLDAWPILIRVDWNICCRTHDAIRGRNFEITARRISVACQSSTERSRMTCSLQGLQLRSHSPLSPSDGTSYSTLYR